MPSMGERLPYPSESDIADAREDALRLDLETAFPARVQSYDGSAQTADLVPLVRRQVPQPDGSHAMEELPVLPCVPVLFPRMGSAFVSLPVAAGDTGLVIVCSGAIGHWRAGDGEVSDPGDLRRHHPSHAVFLPLGLTTRARALTQTGAAGAGGAVIGFDSADGSRILLRADGTVEIVAGGRVSIRSSATTTVDLQGGTQPFVNGTAYADTLSTFLGAMATFVGGTGAAISALGVFCAAVGAHPLLTAVLATPASTLATAMTAYGGVVSTFGTAITTFGNARASYLSTKIRGS